MGKSVYDKQIMNGKIKGELNDAITELKKVNPRT
jgi:hypothetical protein